MNEKAAKMNIYKGYIHYYIGDEYIGLFVFDKGELSDHRGIIRQNRIKIDKESLYKVIKTGLFALLNHYLAEKKLINDSELQDIKTKIVKNSEANLKSSAIEIIDNNMLRLKDAE